MIESKADKFRLKVEELSSTGQITPQELEGFQEMFEVFTRTPHLVPEEIAIEYDLEKPTVGGHVMIGMDTERQQMREGMEKIASELTKFLLHERFINFAKYHPPGTKPRLRGLLLAVRPPAPKKVPVTKKD